MKTTVEIADSLFAAVRRVARNEGTTMRALIEEGLRRIVRERADRGGFELRKVSFRGEGIRPDLEDGSWEQIRRRIYEHHGE
ncbi:MAG TPA: type II toxin-antitoxin system VapB family antitoxin [Gemmatimonadota bacterium]|nr:type II toxin-antitoxin system VapB family antitoxin [Gemmatimonadota bacterium]